MLSGEGNVNSEKTTIGLISKKATLHVQHTFYILIVPLPLFTTVTTTTWNFQKLPKLHVLWRKCRTCSSSLFFSLPLIFIVVVATSYSLFLTAATKFSCCSSIKKYLFCFSLALTLCRPFSRWVSLACRLLSLFLCLSLSLYSKFVDMTINLRQKLIRGWNV